MSEDLQALNLRVAVLTIRSKDLAEEAKAVRREAEREYMDIRRAGTKAQTPILPDGTEAGTITIKAGRVEVQPDEDKLLEFVQASTPEQVEDYLVPQALSDQRVLKLIGERFPDLVDRRVKTARRAELLEELATTGGTLVNGDGEKVTLATIVRMQASGEFSYLPGKQGTAAIRAALAAGTITPDGRIANQDGLAAAGPATEADGDQDSERGNLRLLPVQQDGAA